MTKEYYIWGYSGPLPDGTAAPDEFTLLLGSIEGQLIASQAEAEKYMGILTTRHGCHGCQIQVIDMAMPPNFNQLFASSVNV